MSNKRNYRPGKIYHVFNRGSKKEAVFFESIDYQRFLNKLLIYSSETKDTIIQYCLLPNHFHLILKAYGTKTISLLMRKLQISHGKYICKKYSFTGNVFQHHYKSVDVSSDVQLKILSRYVHRNAAEYFDSANALYRHRWCSYKAYIGEKRSPLVANKVINSVIKLFGGQKEYKKFVEADNISVQVGIKAELSKL